MTGLKADLQSTVIIGGDGTGGCCGQVLGGGTAEGGSPVGRRDGY